MKIEIITGSPNDDGQTAACAQAAATGCLEAGAEAEVHCLNVLDIGPCQACNKGWGTCGLEHYCQVSDGFQALHKACLDADGLVLVSPIYFRDISESMRAFTDRLRRCEAKYDSGPLVATPIIAVCAAGGNGTWVTNSLTTMETLIWHLKARRFDLIPIVKWNREYKVPLVQTAARSMVEELRSTS